MRYPEFLKEQGSIGFLAPSFGCNISPYKEAFDAALETFQSMGFTTVLGPNCYEGRGIGISNTPKACGRELMDSYLDEASDVLISCGGGELMCEILDHVNFEVIGKARPKWYMGYSDNTNMTFLLNTLCDVAAIYGPNAASFGMEPWHEAIEDAFLVLTGQKLTLKGYPLWESESLKDKEHPLVPYNTTRKRRIRTYPRHKDAVFSGRLIGGCMDCLVNLLGTRYDRVADYTERYKEDGIVWFLESCDLNVFGMRRAIWQMAHAGWFNHVRGFLIGRPYHYGEKELGLDQYHAVYELLKPYKVPILMDLDIGHLPPAMPLISGSLAQVTLKGQDLTVEMQLK